jgi:hypothetical protein
VIDQSAGQSSLRRTHTPKADTDCGGRRHRMIFGS